MFALKSFRNNRGCWGACTSHSWEGPPMVEKRKGKKIQRALGEKSLTFSTNIKNSTVPPCQLFPRGTLMLLVASEGLLCQVEVHLDEGLKSCENRPSICPAGTERVWPMGLSLAHIPAISGIFCNMRREAWPEIPNWTAAIGQQGRGKMFPAIGGKLDILCVNSGCVLRPRLNRFLYRSWKAAGYNTFKDITGDPVWGGEADNIGHPPFLAWGQKSKQGSSRHRENAFSLIFRAFVRFVLCHEIYPAEYVANSPTTH